MGTPLYRKSLLIFLSILCSLAISTLHVQAELNIVATTEYYGALTKIVGADKVKVSVLVRGGQNPHAVEVKPSYSVLLNRADLLVTNGQLLEVGWLDIALINARNPRITQGEEGFVDCSLGVDLIPYEFQEIEGTPLFMPSPCLLWHRMSRPSGADPSPGSGGGCTKPPGRGAGRRRTSK